MPRTLHTFGEYPADWPAISDRVCVEAGNRCLRCHHPYVKGAHGSGQWTPCDLQCRHGGPVSHGRAPGGGFCDWAEWRILTTHHLDGNKANCRWWNLLPLCQRCHLIIQGKVNPDQPFMLEHSEWFKPYVAGFYAMKYEGREIIRETALAEMDRLLAWEKLS